MENELVEIRKNIDRIDADLLALFVERMQCSEQVAKIKRNAGLPIQNATREQEILQRVSKRAGEYGFAATALYTTIMAVSRAHQHILLDSTPEFSDLARTGEKNFLQSHVRIICQGVEGAYSHRAARQVFTDSTV
ncbi:MAG: chorismate mutase, partial [Oscillospiraceae bacterium]